MAMPNVVDSTQELLDAQTQVWNHIFSYINSMSLKCALQLGIPDIIHKHDEPITLSELVDALPINKEKSHGLYRLMRILVHSKIFNKVKNGDGDEAYSLTPVSRLLLRDERVSFAPFALLTTDPIFVEPFHNLPDWFHDECSSPFVTRNGLNFWEFAGNNDRWNQLFNEAMACDARFVGGILVKECKHVFEGVETMVDVAGGTGEVAKAVAAAFSELKCIVLDLPHVVAGLQDYENLSFVGGDMFDFIPQADAVLLKWNLHIWSNEECVKILRKCKEAITQSKSGKVIILEMVVDDEREGHATELCFDIMLMTQTTGSERSEREWANIFSAAGFKDYKITPIFGLRSLIELFP